MMADLASIIAGLGGEIAPWAGRRPAGPTPTAPFGSVSVMPRDFRLTAPSFAAPPPPAPAPAPPPPPTLAEAPLGGVAPAPTSGAPPTSSEDSYNAGLPVDFGAPPPPPSLPLSESSFTLPDDPPSLGLEQFYPVADLAGPINTSLPSPAVEFDNPFAPSVADNFASPPAQLTDFYTPYRSELAPPLPRDVMYDAPTDLSWLSGGQSLGAPLGAVGQALGVGNGLGLAATIGGGIGDTYAANDLVEQTIGGRPYGPAEGLSDIFNSMSWGLGGSDAIATALDAVERFNNPASHLQFDPVSFAPPAFDPVSFALEQQMLDAIIADANEQAEYPPYEDWQAWSSWEPSYEDYGYDPSYSSEWY